VLPGGAGLVGQNLVARLRQNGYHNIVVIDKHRANLAALQRVQPDIVTECADLAEPGNWQGHFNGAGVVVMLQAQIGGTDYEEFVRNNVTASAHILAACKAHGVARLIPISSSVVVSAADDFYTRSKREQEAMVLASGIACPILRPTLMFGWFDRKHLGWLSRFMRKVPVFPIPGHGRYMRQPLYVGDFCHIIMACIERDIPPGVYNISGREEVDYIDIIRQIKATTGARALVLRIPYSLFYALIWTWSRFDSNPPFTTQQLAALSTPDRFEVIDWPAIFGVRSTSFADAITETFTDPTYSQIVMEF
jgi:nucleoside-diphosphate-sugar epimerase